MCIVLLKKEEFMRRTKLRITTAKVRRGDVIENYWCVIVPKLGGGRTRRFFKFTDEGKKEAETFLGISKIQQINYGTAALTLSTSQRMEYLEALETLEPYGISLREAMQMLLPQLKASNRSCTVENLAAEIYNAKEADGASKRYLGDLKSRLSIFAKTFGERTVASLSFVEIDGWLRSLPVAAATRNNYRRVLAVTLNFAKDRGYCLANHAEHCPQAKAIAGEIGILTVEETARLMEHAKEETLPYWVIGAFAGLRSAEIERLDWSEIDFEAGLIEVKASKAKTASRRLVTMQPNLREWLTPYSDRQGPVCPIGLRKKLEADRDAAKLRKSWPSNALRHSFGSHHLAKFQDAAALALQMGNSPGVIFKHYREVVRPIVAEKYWNIRPAVVENVVAMSA